mmetsp:Transcript_26972/g.68601  ORF Transcript_26972/g.68601 Transcript_26972/m.68601 type:complete len:325 (-) Transcript_26972:157-1131(-)
MSIFLLLAFLSYDALADNVHAGRPGFRMDEVAGDCLHPMHGSKGNDYVAELMINWLVDANAQRSHVQKREPAGADSVADSLPAPLTSSSFESELDHRACFTLDRPEHGGWLGKRRADKMSLAWRTASCPRRGCTAEQAEEARQHPPVECPSARDRLRLAQFVEKEPPPVFFFCHNSLNPNNPKRLPGAVGLRPGATLYLPFRPGSSVGARAGDDVCVSIWYLTSYEHMGMATLRCAQSCGCQTHRLDAHAIESWHGRNASIYREFRLRTRVSEAASDCVIELRIDEHSSSGGHKFRVSDVQLQKAGHQGGDDRPCLLGQWNGPA